MTTDHIGGLVATYPVDCAATIDLRGQVLRCVRAPKHHPPHRDYDGGMWFDPLDAAAEADLRDRFGAWLVDEDWQVRDEYVKRGGVTVFLPTAASPTLIVELADRCYRRLIFQPWSFREVVDLLAAIRVIGPQWSSLYASGFTAGATSAPAGCGVIPGPLRDVTEVRHGA